MTDTLSKLQVIDKIAGYQEAIAYADAADFMSSSDKQMKSDAQRAISDLESYYSGIYGKNLSALAMVHSERERVRHWIKSYRAAKDDWNRNRYRSFIQSAWADYRYRVDWFERCYGSRQEVAA